MFGFFGYVRRAASVAREHLKRRSPKWPAFRRLVLSSNKRCVACGSTKWLQVHHIEPYHLAPERELDLSNVIVLCMGPNECHLRLGHGDDFRAFNPKIVFHADMARKVPHDRPTIEMLALSARLYEGKC